MSEELEMAEAVDSPSTLSLKIAGGEGEIAEYRLKVPEIGGGGIDRPTFVVEGPHRRLVVSLRDGFGYGESGFVAIEEIAVNKDALGNAITFWTHEADLGSPADEAVGPAIAALALAVQNLTQDKDYWHTTSYCLRKQLDEANDTVADLEETNQRLRVELEESTRTVRSLLAERQDKAEEEAAR